MHSSVFSQMAFWLLIIVSFVLPALLYVTMVKKRAIARHTVLLLGVMLLIIAAVDVYLLQRLATLAKLTPSLADDVVFVSELSLALYLVPVVFGGVGINVISHILITHLAEAEQRFEADRSNSQ